VKLAQLANLRFSWCDPSFADFACIPLPPLRRKAERIQSVPLGFLFWFICAVDSMGYLIGNFILDIPGKRAKLSSGSFASSLFVRSEFPRKFRNATPLA